jgi:3-oxoacyl-[acyl-carrier-protein] synthase II
LTARDNQVVISGLGVVSALSNHLEEFWQSCLAGNTVVDSIPEQWRHYYKPKSDIWSPLVLPDYPSYGLTRADTLRFDPVVLNAIVAADDALVGAGITKTNFDERAKTFRLHEINRDKVGVFMGTGLGCISSAFNNYVPHLLGAMSNELIDSEHAANDEEHNPISELRQNLATHPRVSPFASCQSMANAIGAMLSIRYGSRGATETFVSACAAGTTAIARAYRAIQHGEVDLAIAGGSEYYGDRAGGVFMAFDRLQTLVREADQPDRGNCPFDENRSGFLFSQGGCGIVVLESEAHARRRGVTPIARIIGMSITSDAYSLAAISKEDNAIELMFENLFSDGGVAASDIGYVNAHGTSTYLNDLIESEIIERVFPNRPFVNSTKSLLGHTIGASGAIECIVAALSIRDGKIHPSRNLQNPIADLNFATRLYSSDIEFAVSHSFGFGGHNAGLILQSIQN